MINIQPSKVTVQYHFNDSIFFVLLCISFLAVLGRDMRSKEDYFYSTAMALTIFLAAFVPIFYIIFLISSWLVSRRRRINMLVKRPRH